MTPASEMKTDSFSKKELFDSLRDEFKEFINEWAFFHMKAVREEGLPLSQFFLLKHLRSCQSLDLTTITNFLGVTKPTVTGLIDTLEKDGFVKRVHDEDDRRRITIELTPKSDRIFERLESGTFSLFGDVFLSLPDEVIAKLHETIGKMREIIRDNIEQDPDQIRKRSDNNDR